MTRHWGRAGDLSFHDVTKETMMKRNKSTIADRNRKAITGIGQYYATLTSIVLDGVPFKPAAITKILQDQVDAADKTAAARAAFRQAVAAERAVSAQANAAYLALKNRVFSDFKSSVETLSEFGLAMPQRRKPAPATEVEAAAKRKATRAKQPAPVTVTPNAAG